MVDLELVSCPRQFWFFRLWLSLYRFVIDQIAVFIDFYDILYSFAAVGELEGAV